MMKLWVLEVIESGGYDEYDSKAVIAEDEVQARSLANENTGDEGKIWVYPTHVACTEISLDKYGPIVLLESFNAG